MKELIEKLRVLPHFEILPPMGVPEVASKHELPKDVREFYELCGGLTVFGNECYSVRVVSPEEFVLANPIILGEEVIEMAKKEENYDDLICNDWYIIADLNDSNYVVMDLNAKRGGRCYDAFWETYALEGDSPIVALSLTDFLERLLKSDGEHWYWFQDSFEPLGDAYDE